MIFKKIAVVAAMLAGSTVANAAGQTIFEAETLGLGSNDTFLTAQNIGTLGANSDINIFGSRLSALPGGTSLDFFKFTLGSTLDLNFAVNTPYGITFQNDPIVGLFSSTGVAIETNDDAGPGYDALIRRTLTAGTYFVGVTGYSDFSFTGTHGSNNWLYELNVTTAAPNEVLAAPVPEPETYALFLAGLGLLGAAARRKKSA
jgi:PEP-CTERM motif